jgi:hypothetical protein
MCSIGTLYLNKIKTLFGYRHVHAIDIYLALIPAASKP